MNTRVMCAVMASAVAGLGLA
ncbi:MAG: hypothetical protein RLZ94_819, partial [Actinomycetota bacterium]